MTSHHFRLLFKKWSRLIHIYLSMLGLLVILFFSITPAPALPVPPIFRVD